MGDAYVSHETQVRRPLLHPLEGPLRVAAVGVPSLAMDRIPEPGDRHLGFVVKPMRCWTLVGDGTLHADHFLDEATSWTGQRSPPHGEPLVLGPGLYRPPAGTDRLRQLGRNRGRSRSGN